MIGWNIKILSEEDRKEVAIAWYSMAAGRPHVAEDSEEDDIEQDVE